MAAATGTYGSRKSQAQFPRLTGKAAFDIGGYMYNEASVGKGTYMYKESLSTDEIKFVMGMLLCNLWQNGDEHLISPTWYDVGFASFRDDPIGCIKLFLRSKGVELGENDSRFDDLMENSFKLGYITSDPAPYVGSISFLNNGGGKFDCSTVEIFRNERSTPLDTKQLFISIATNETTPDKLNWNVLLWQTAFVAFEAYNYLDDMNGFYGYQGHPDEIAEARISFNNAKQITESYDTEVRSLIEKGNIVVNGHDIGKVELS